MCASHLCFADTCLDRCAGGQTDCDTAFGGTDIAYCETEIFTSDLCLPLCGTGELWDAGQCESLDDGFTCGMDNRCQAPAQ